MNLSLAQEATTVRARPTAARSVWERVGRALDRAIFFALLALIALVAVPYGTVEPWWEAAFESAVFVLGALWAAEGLLSGEWRVREIRLVAPLLSLAVFAFLQTLPLWGPGGGAAGIETGLWKALSADPYETWRFTLKLLALVLAGELLFCYTSSPRRLRALIFIVIGVCIASASFGIVRQMMQRDTLGFILPHLEPNSGYGQLINRNHFALLMEMALGLLAGLMLGGGVRRERLLAYAAAALPVWVALVLTTSRGGIFSMLSQILFVILAVGLVRSRRGEDSQQRGVAAGWLWTIFGSLVVRVVLVACLLGAVTLSIMWVGGDPLVTRLERLSGQVNAEGIVMHDGASRQEVWRATWELFRAHPVAGVGFGGYGVAITEHHAASGKKTPEAAHNDYLELLASGGLLGTALAVWFVTVFLRRARIRLSSADPLRRAACIGALTGIFGVAIHSLFDFGLHITINALVLIALMVIAAVDERVEADGRHRGFERPELRRERIGGPSPSF